MTYVHYRLPSGAVIYTSELPPPVGAVTLLRYELGSPGEWKPMDCGDILKRITPSRNFWADGVITSGPNRVEYSRRDGAPMPRDFCTYCGAVMQETEHDQNLRQGYDCLYCGGN